jgi:hypothetical protein
VGDSSGTIPVVANGDTQEEITHCPKCGTEIMDAPGIGEFCPNKECDVVDNLLGTVDPEVDAFFKRIRVIAKLQDIEDEQADIDEANALIAEIEPEETVTDLSEEPKEEPYPFPMERPLEGDAKLAQEEQDIIDSMPVLENEELWASRVIDENQDEPDDTDAKRQWKMLNPHDTIKRQRSLYDRGIIESLPWDTIEQFDSEKEELERVTLETEPLVPDYEPDDGPLTEEQLAQVAESVEESKKKELHNEAAGSADQEETVNYVQNSEQNSESIWKRIQERKS